MINEVEPYPNAPVTEAIFDIQVELPKKATILSLEQLCSDIANSYPEKRARKRFEGKFEIRDNRGSITESTDLGIDKFQNWSADKKQVIQFGLDGFSFSRLRPYTRWEDHFPEFIKNWDLYALKLSPMRIKRIAIRFINTIEIPSGKFELNDYFVNPPSAPVNTGVLSNFFSRIEVSLAEVNTKAVITQASAQSSNPAIVPIIFDLEVFKEISSLPDAKMLSDAFKNLRDIKNEIFENSLTPKTKALFQ